MNTFIRLAIVVVFTFMNSLWTVNVSVECVSVLQAWQLKRQTHTASSQTNVNIEIAATITRYHLFHSTQNISV